jgi:hypothetical protein
MNQIAFRGLCASLANAGGARVPDGYLEDALHAGGTENITIVVGRTRAKR